MIWDIKFKLFIKRIIPNSIKQFIFRHNIKLKTQNINFGKHVRINSKTEFEGYNAIYDKSELTSSYIGFGSYIANNSIIRGAKIGRFCSIGDNVRTGLGLHPTSVFVSTHPAFFSLNKQAGFTFAKEQKFAEHKYIDEERKYYVEIGNDVWIGNNVMIQDGNTIGDGAIIAAGAIVTKDVEPFSIVGGVPAKIIKKRFTEEQIKKLLAIKWWIWSFEKIKKNHSMFGHIDKFLK